MDFKVPSGESVAKEEEHDEGGAKWRSLQFFVDRSIELYKG
jgi:hypothetical protein